MSDYVVLFIGRLTMFFGSTLFLGWVLLFVLEVWWRLFRYAKGIPKLVKKVNKIVEQKSGEGVK